VSLALHLKIVSLQKAMLSNWLDSMSIDILKYFNQFYNINGPDLWILPKGGTKV
jgi:hypothetical protein